MGNKLLSIYQTLHNHYGDLHWWSAETPYEVMVGAVLTQNTAWGNVEKAIANFGEKLSPELDNKPSRSADFVHLKREAEWWGLD